MRKSMRIKHFVAPALLTLAAMGLGTGCSSAKDAVGGNCAADLSLKFDTFGQSVKDLQAVEASVTTSVFAACSKIAKDLGSTVAIPTLEGGATVSSDDTTTACNAAGDAITSAIGTAKASGTFTLSIAPAVCTVDASAQLDCEGKCNVSAKCDPPTITGSCDPGHLSGTCSGTCTGSCTADLTVAASCSGTCNGTCDGTCTASAGTTSNGGACDGTCSGNCKGSCTAAVGATASCSGTCSAGCSVDYTAPKCDVALTPPKCDAAADCNAGCDGSASLKASCTPPSVTVTATGTGAATLKATLEANLPTLIKVAAQGKMAGTAVLGIGERAVGVAGDLTASLGCVAKYGADFTAKVQASVQASANVSASFSASASVSGKATAG